MVFEKKKLEKTKRVCSRLKEARAAAKLSPAAVAQKTKIRPAYVRALEECRFDDIPYALIYQKHFIRRYAEVVGLPTPSLLQQFVLEDAPARPPLPRQKRRLPSRCQNLPALLKGMAVTVVVLGLLSYLGWQVHSIVTPPALAIFTPPDGYVTTQSDILIYGATAKEARVYLNGQEITTDGQGQFEKTVNLSPGINTLEISAKKRHGKISRSTRHVILKTAERLSFNH